MTNTVASLAVRLTADDNDLQAGLGRAQTGITGLGNAFRGVIAGIGLQKITSEIVGSAVAWESAFAGVVKTVDGTPEQLAELEEGLRKLAISGVTSGLQDAHTELARIAELAGQLGVSRDHIIEFTDVIAQLGMTTDLTGEQGATMLAQFANITRMDMGNIDRLGAAIVDLGNNSATTESQIVEFGQRLAGAGVQAGLAETEILAFGASMASLGLNPEAGGTAFTQTMNTIIEAAALGGEKLDVLANASSMTADAFRDSWKDDPAKTLVAFLEGLSTMSPAEQLSALDDLGLSGIRTSDTLRRLSGNVDLVKNSLDIAAGAWEENTALQDEANKRFVTTESQFAAFNNNISNLAISLGRILLPVINDVVSRLNAFLSEVDIEGGLAAWTGVFENAEIIWNEIWRRIRTAWDENVVQPIAGVQETISLALSGFGAWIDTYITQPIANLAVNVKAGLDDFVALVTEKLNWLKDNVVKPLADMINGILGGLGAAGGAIDNAGTAVGMVASGQVTPGDFLGALGNAISMEFAPRAVGGPVSAGSGYLVGERGPELFVPGRSGRIVPNDALGGGHTIMINAYGESPHELARMIQSAMSERDY